MAVSTLPKPLLQAERHYFGTFDQQGRRLIFAQYLWLSGSKPGMTIGANSATADGGCGVYNVWYDPFTETIVKAGCGGRG